MDFESELRAKFDFIVAAAKAGTLEEEDDASLTKENHVQNLS
jgi:hypothetical protein